VYTETNKTLELTQGPYSNGLYDVYIYIFFLSKPNIAVFVVTDKKMADVPFWRPIKTIDGRQTQKGTHTKKLEIKCPPSQPKQKPVFNF
jgi:hypothetical protein